MLLSLALVFLVGLSLSAIFERLRLPGIVGMMLTGVLLGPFVLDLLDPSLLGISAELRKAALVIILIRAGLKLDLNDLKRVGRPAVLMSFLPASCEVVGYIIFAPLILNVSVSDAAVMGAVMGAVSPAVVVPRMLRLMDRRRGTAKGVPQLITAGASCDDIFTIVIFTAFLSMSLSGTLDFNRFADIPISVVLGALLGAAAGLALSLIFALLAKRGRAVSADVSALVLLALALLLTAVESALDGVVAVSGLLAVVAAACVLKLRSGAAVTASLSRRFSALWVGAQVLLFVLVGAAVDVSYAAKAGLAAVAVILLALLFRTAGVLISLVGTRLNAKERLFCVIAYLPKATVQAAIGSVPLAAGLGCGELILSVAVIGIMITAPLGAIGIDVSCEHLLSDDSAE